MCGSCSCRHQRPWPGSATEAQVCWSGLSFISVTQGSHLSRPTSHVLILYSSLRQIYRYVSESGRYPLKELMVLVGSPSICRYPQEAPTPMICFQNAGEFFHVAAALSLIQLIFYQSFTIIQSVFIGRFPIFNGCSIGQRYSFPPSFMNV